MALVAASARIRKPINVPPSFTARFAIVLVSNAVSASGDARSASREQPANIVRAIGTECQIGAFLDGRMQIKEATYGQKITPARAAFGTSRRDCCFCARRGRRRRRRRWRWRWRSGRWLGCGERRQHRRRGDKRRQCNCSRRVYRSGGFGYDRWDELDKLSLGCQCHLRSQ
jgi:hypothetical protein